MTISRKAAYFVPVIVEKDDNYNISFVTSICEYYELELKTNLNLHSTENYFLYILEDYPKLREEIYENFLPDAGNTDEAAIQVQNFVQQCLLRVAQYHKMTKSEIAGEISKIHAQKQNARAERGKRYDEFAKFSDPTALADFSHWFSLYAWDPLECATLSMGFDPRSVTEKDFRGFGWQNSETASRFNRVKQAIELAVHMRDLAKLIRPTNFIIFARENRIPISAEMLKFASRQMQENSSRSKSDLDIDVQGKTKRSHYIILYALLRHALNNKELSADENTYNIIQSIVEKQPELRLARGTIRNMTINIINFHNDLLDEHRHG